MTDAKPSVVSAGVSDVGRVRRHNEDSFLLRPEIGLWTVADGMGGHAAGDFASQKVVEAMARVERAGSAAAFLAGCEAALADANRTIRDHAAQNGLGTIGTTVVLLLIHDAYFACLWSGDSRVYGVRDGVISQITRDHTEAQELIAQGVLTEEQALTWPRRNVITRAVGVFDEPSLELQHGALQPGDVFVLCSDGLTAHVAPAEILAAASKPPPQAARALIDLTLERGATDNVTVVVVRYDGENREHTLPPGEAAPRLWE